jgi:anti-anti-sigma factor
VDVIAGDKDGDRAARWIQIFTRTREVWMPGADGVGSFDRRCLRLRSYRVDGAYMVSLAGEFDLAAVEAVERELRRAEATDAAVVVLDLRELAFMDVSGIRVIVLAQRRLGDRLAVVKATGAVHRILEICGLDERLRLVEAPPPALRSASRRRAVGDRIDQATLATAVRELRGHRRSGLHGRFPSR